MAENGVKPNSLQFLIEAAARRAPGKRQVKVRPAEELEDVALAAGDEDDDTDFHCTDKEESDSDDDSNEESESESDANELDKESRVQSPSALSDVTEAIVDAGLDACGLLCCLCLNMRQGDELLQCDRCSLAVHESCYGSASDTESVHSDNSSCSTEPWFCEPCILAVDKPQLLHCQLCPVIGGVLKQVDSGSWVHLLCALYTPNVTFGDAETLRCISLFEMGYQNFGARKCYICSDKLLARTGVCVKCDAGLCKSYAHVSCAMANGLLVDQSYSDEHTVHATADPRYILCKQHSDQDLMRRKKHRYAIVSAQMKEIDKRGMKQLAPRENRALNRQRSHLRNKIKELSNWFPRDQKWPRALSTSACLIKKMQNKSMFQGISNEEFRKKFKPEITMEMIGKAKVSPAFGPEFILYFNEREHKLIPQLEREKETLEKVCQKLRNKQTQIESKLNVLHSDDTLEQKALNSLINHVKALGATNIKMTTTLKTNKQTNVKANNIKVSIELHNCGTCNGGNNQHLMALCDTCHKHYHLACLDPPLTKMPKKTMIYGWECSTCFHTSSSSEDELARTTRRKSTPNKKYSLVVWDSKKRKLERRMPVTRSLRSGGGSCSPEKSTIDVNVKKEEVVDNAPISSKRGRLSQFTVRPADSIDLDDEEDEEDDAYEFDEHDMNDFEASVKAKPRAVAPVNKSKTPSQSTPPKKKSPTAKEKDRKRKFSPRAQYTNKTLGDAIESVVEGRMTTINACSYFKVPRSTLFRLVSQRRKEKKEEMELANAKPLPKAQKIEDINDETDLAYEYVAQEEEVMCE